jgi:peptidoglycan hydrolase-like protein with peptidoglycan-binding domain
VLRRSAAGRRTPSGHLVQILQAALKQANFYDARVDGAYGPATEAAVKRFQEARHGKGDGACSAADWEDITGLAPPSLFDRCVHLTAAFEGTGFQGAVGNFDGAWLTFGLIGLTLKSDLPEFITKCEQDHPGTCERAFGANAPTLKQMLTAAPAQKEAWANSISTGSDRYGLRTDWKEGFARLGSFPEVQRLQLENARDRYWTICVRDAKRWGAADTLDVALFYDTAVQMGGLAGRPEATRRMDALQRDEPSLKGRERRLRWAQIIADAANPRWKQDVLTRRSTFADGSGKVHGDAFQLADWGLSAHAIDIDALGSAHITFMPPSFRTVPGADQPAAAAASADATELAARGPVAEPAPAAGAPHSDRSANALNTDRSVSGEAQASASVTASDFDLARDYKVLVAAALTRITRQGIDRNWGSGPDIAPAAVLEKEGTNIGGAWRNWPAERQAVAVIQIICKDKGADAGVIDGQWGHATGAAYERLCYFRDHGRLPDVHSAPNNGTAPSGANPHGWPKESQASLTAFYGRHCEASLVTVRSPWKLVASWDASADLTNIRCHKKVADSLRAVLEAVHAHYGEAELKRLRLDQYGGCFNCRPKREGTDWSTHSWAIALDWDPDRNQLKWGRDRASLAKPEYDAWWEIWEREGWYSLGRRHNFDWMHVQAAWM